MRSIVQDIHYLPGYINTDIEFEVIEIPAWGKEFILTTENSSTLEQPINTELLVGKEVIGFKTKTDITFYDVLDKTAGWYLEQEERVKLIKDLGLKHTKVSYKKITLNLLGVKNLEDLQKLTKTLNKGKPLLFRSVDGTIRFYVTNQ